MRLCKMAQFGCPPHTQGQFVTENPCSTERKESKTTSFFPSSIELPRKSGGGGGRGGGGVGGRGGRGGAGWPGGLAPVGVAGPGQEGVDYLRGAFARAGDTVAAA